MAYKAPTIADDDDAAGASVSCTPASGATFPIGSTTVTCTARDPDDSNSPVSASFTVAVAEEPAQSAPRCAGGTDHPDRAAGDRLMSKWRGVVGCVGLIR